MRSILPISYLILLGLLLSSGACCSPGVTSPGKSSPTNPARETPVPVATTTIPTTVVPEMGFTPTSIKPSLNDVEITKEAVETVIPLTEPLTITVVYDNNAYDGRLKSAWGFSALVEYREHKLLFDTGGDGPTLMENMRTLGIDPTHIESVVLSHAHADHTGGLSALLEAGARPTVYLLPSFPAAFKSRFRDMATVVEVSVGQSITEGLFTTGEMGRSIPEQALVIRTDQGLVVITGCAHPGIVEIVEQAREMFDEPVELVLGGFHLGSKSEAEIDVILKEFRRLEVKHVAPCHCTGERAIALFASEFGEDFIQAGVGKVIRMEGGNP